MKTSALSFGSLNNGSSFSKGKIIVIGNGNGLSASGDLNYQPTIKAYKSKFASSTPSLPFDVNMKPFQQDRNERSNSHDFQSSSEESGDSPRQDSTRLSIINTTNNSLNTTFSGMYHKLVGREKRRPQCTPPIRTVVSIGFLKENYERQVQGLEKQRQNDQPSQSITQDEKETPSLLNAELKKNIQQSEKHSTNKPKVTWGADLTSCIQLQEESLTTDSETSNWIELEMERRPSLGPVMRSVCLKRDSLVGEEENTKTRFIGESDKRRFEDLDWKNQKQTQMGRKSNVSSNRPSTKAPTNSFVQSSQPTTRPSVSTASSIETNQQTKHQSKRLFIPSKKPNTDREEEEEHESNHVHERKVIEKKQLVQKKTNPQILDENSIEKFKHIAKWIENDLGIEFNSSIQCENDLRTGLKFAEIVARVEGEGKMKGINKQPQTTAAMHNNLERVFSVLRDNKTIELQYLWSTKEVIAGEYDTIWGLLGDIYKAYLRKTSKVKKTSKKQEKNRLSPNHSFEYDIEQENFNHGFSIEDINRMKRELLESQ